MNRHQTFEEISCENELKLGPELGPLFTQLCQEIYWLQSIWNEFQELFAKSGKRVDILNESGSFFFYIVQTTMWNDILLRIRRVTDPKKSAGKDNLTVMRLADLCPDDSLKAKIADLANKADQASQFAKVWRNRKIAHADLELSLGRSAVPLPTVKYEEVSNAITAIHDILNTISCELLGTEMLNEPIIGAEGAEAVLYVLRDGLDAQQSFRERMRNGALTPSDIQRRKTPI